MPEVGWSPWMPLWNLASGGRHPPVERNNRGLTPPARRNRGLTPPARQIPQAHTNSGPSLSPPRAAPILTASPGGGGMTPTERFDVVAAAAHPDDLEITCGGTL